MRALVDLLFPPSCLACAAPGFPFLCDACDRAFPWVTTACHRCGRPLPAPADSCGDCRALRPAFARARAAAVYEGAARDALKAFKLGGERRAAPHLARAMQPVAAALRADVVTFVPATRRTERERGFNPAAELARPLARALHLPLAPLLSKVRETADQAQLSRSGRLRNLAGAFSARAAAAGSEPLVVDDVMTTGVTASLCARALLDAGAASVSVVTFARAV